ncbi:MAG: hypothetical protein HQM08_25240 [Candidatus Riflebacteria bacterium]|nr:hypothetical protein [Candidatus Riflebacteria bacterium]
MRKRYIGILFLGLFFASFSFADVEECMIIGAKGNPEKARELFTQALKFWEKGNASSAVESFEQAVIEDRSILANDDKGIGLALIKSYKERVEKKKPSVEMLCRLGYFENVISGNLEDAIARYGDAEEKAVSENVKKLAHQEKERLSQELKYIRDWYAEHLKEVHKSKAKDLAELIVKEKLDEKNSKILELEELLQQISERITYLKNEEKSTAEEMSAAITRASRYRRYYYNYSGADTSAEANLGFVNNPMPSPPGAPSNASDLQFSADSVAPHSAQTDLNNFYAARHHSEEFMQKLAQIRSEIAGLERRQQILEDEIKKVKNGEVEPAQIESFQEDFEEQEVPELEQSPAQESSSY